ncbi:MAG TPA: MFS transporter, partial [Bacteriovoracaceae bacterium]|nr:MFS transporter [Bacteriovoracaceae bacterium]
MNFLRQVFSYKMLTMLLTGYASGFPLLLLGSTLQAWMKNEGVDLTQIGLVSLLGLPYVLKFLWSPLLDRYRLPFLGRRKGWMALFQILIVTGIFGLSTINPSQDLGLLAFWALLISFASASQDIVIDAYRREILPDEELGLGSSLYVNGYRLAMLASGAFALYLADQIPWSEVYKWLALMMLPTFFFTFIAPKEGEDSIAPRDLKT